MANINVIVDETTMSIHYADEENMGKLWEPTVTKVEMQLTRMAVVLLALVPFLLEQPRLTNELYDELAGKIVQADTAGGNIGRDDCAMLLKWCLAAA